MLSRAPDRRASLSARRAGRTTCRYGSIGSVDDGRTDPCGRRRKHRSGPRQEISARSNRPITRPRRLLPSGRRGLSRPVRAVSRSRRNDRPSDRNDPYVELPHPETVADARALSGSTYWRGVTLSAIPTRTNSRLRAGEFVHGRIADSTRRTMGACSTRCSRGGGRSIRRAGPTSVRTAAGRSLWDPRYRGRRGRDAVGYNYRNDSPTRTREFAHGLVADGMSGCGRFRWDEGTTAFVGRDEAGLEEIYVDPGYRGGGSGRRSSRARSPSCPGRSSRYARKPRGKHHRHLKRGRPTERGRP
jgi:hypothetical protein